MVANLRAIIIGGGIGGVTTAIALSRRGIAATVYERAPAPAEVGAGISLWGNAIKALHKIDAVQGVLEAGEEMRTGELRRSDGKCFSRADMAAADERLGAPSFLIHRADLLDALLACAPPGAVRFGSECTGYDEDPTGVIARFADGRSDRADLLIGADGVHSAVRAQLLSDGPPRYAGYTCWRGVTPVPADRLEPGYVCEAWGRGDGQRFGITRIGADRVYWWAALSTPSGGSDADAKSRLLDLFRGWFQPIPDLIAATDAAAILRNDIVDRPPVRNWTSPLGRVTLLGDAAHPTTPNLGQGGCMAIESAVVLARRLAESLPFGDVAAATRAYQNDRFNRTARITRFSHRLGAVGHTRNPIGRRARDVVMSIMPLAAVLANHRKTVGFDV